LSWENWTHNLGAKILALVCAVALWLTVTNGQEFEKTLTFPIEYVNRPAGLTSIQQLPATATAKVRGRGKFLRYTTRGGVCRVDLIGTQIGRNSLLLDGSNLKIPSDAGVSRAEVIEPQRIVVEFDETVVRDIPITPTIAGKPDPRYVQVGKTFLNPTDARVKGPRRLVDEITLLATRPIDIEGHRSTVRKKIRLASPASPTVEITPASVDVGITIEPVLDQSIEGLALEFSGEMDSDWVAVARPPDLSVEIRGARSIVEVAVREVGSVALSSDAWSLGSTILRLKEIRGRDLVFAPHETFPLVTSPPWGGEVGTEPPPPGPALPHSGKVAPAVRGEVVASLGVPRDVEIVGVDPDRFAVLIRKKSDLPPELVRNDNDSPEPAP
jgi:hypothetical protein